MKKSLFVFSILFLFAPVIFSQVSVNPQEQFYSDAVGWYQKGYVERLPQLKPYPVNVIKNMLETVMQDGEPSEQKKASVYYSEFFGKPLPADFMEKSILFRILKMKMPIDLIIFTRRAPM